MTKSFKWLNITQAVGALNDNAFKMLAVIVLVSKLNYELSKTLALASVLLVVPFLIFSNWAGALADRFSKRSIIMMVKWVELALLVLAIPAVISGMAWPVMAVLFLLASQSAFFGPVKRGIVPELVKAGDLSRANGALTGATYLAIISGLVLPSLAITLFGVSYVAVLCGCIVLSLGGLAAASRLPHTQVLNHNVDTSPRFAVAAVKTMISLKSNIWLYRALCGLIAFSGLTALFQQALMLYGKDIINLSVESSAFLFLLVAVGIATGGVFAGRLSHHKIEFGLIPAGALLMSLSIMLLGMATNRGWMAALLVASGIGAGMCVVPLSAYVQAEAPADRRGELFGVEGFLSFSAMVVSSLIFYAITSVMGLSARFCMSVTGALAFLAALWAVLRLPADTVRFMLSRLTRVIYRVKVRGIENLPAEGGALLVANHTAYSDANIIQSATSRPIRYVMSRDVFRNWGWCRPIFRLTGAIPLHTGDGPRQLARALENARNILREGGVVCIFPEGKLSRTGAMEEFRKGFEKIAKGTGVPIIPVHLNNLWGSMFSFKYGHPGLRMPRQLKYPVSVRFGAAMPTDTSAEQAREAIAELGVETATEDSLRSGSTLAARFVSRARRSWFAPAAQDTLGKSVTYGKLLSAACALNSRLSEKLANQPYVGVILPPSVAAVLANVALTLQGRCVVNLNWTVSTKAFRSAVKQSGIATVITSRRVESVLDIPQTGVKTLYLEDLLEGLTLREKFSSVIKAACAPMSVLSGNHVPAPVDTASIIFSSGSTGIPKGVMLSHANLLSNLDGMRSVLGLKRSDSLAGILPFFHSLGFLATLWYPLLERVPVTYHANPLQSAQVVRLIRRERISTLLITPTLLQSLMRRADPDDLASLRYVLTGGEKLHAATSEMFERKFGVRPLQGYGATELSPVVALSIPDRTERGYHCCGCREGSVGRALPNLAVKIVDPETGARRPFGESGLLLVKGPSVMCGYLRQPDKTAEVVRDGWYNTGDIARVDKDGFIYLTDRLTRFSKIGGEMVPHGALEEVLQPRNADAEPCVAVVSSHDLAKGERLMVCYTDEAGEPETLRKKLVKHGLPNLWIPALKNFVKISRMPVLGTGKIDLSSVRCYVQNSIAA